MARDVVFVMICTRKYGATCRVVVRVGRMRIIIQHVDKYYDMIDGSLSTSYIYSSFLFCANFCNNVCMTVSMW